MKSNWRNKLGWQEIKQLPLRDLLKKLEEFERTKSDSILTSLNTEVFNAIKDGKLTLESFIEYLNNLRYV